MMVGTDAYKCARCGETKSLDHFYLDKAGRVTGYCRDQCHAAWYREYIATRRQIYNASRAAYMREWQRRRHGTPPDRFRGPYKTKQEAS
jgi:recombinational DNA repair protein (RecF pathway)